MVSIFRTVVSASWAGARRLGVLLLIVLGLATAAPAQPLGTGTITDRVMRIRARLQDAQQQAVVPPADAGARLSADQWGNWPNWNNWRNWANWNNWRNWANWGNWGNF